MARWGVRAACGVCLAAIAVVTAMMAGRRPAEESAGTLPPRPREICLAGRTLAPGRGEFPKRFAERQTPSARGTVPYIVVATRPVARRVRRRAEELGARVVGFMPANALLVEADEKALSGLAADPLFDAAVELEPSDKLSRGLLAATGEVNVTVVPLAAEDKSALGEFIRLRGGRVLAEASRGRDVLRAAIPHSLVDELAARGDVRWMEPHSRPRLLNDVAVNPGLMNLRKAWETHGLTGEGQIISTSDSGIDTGEIATLHTDFFGRILGITNGTSEALLKDIHGHGTHTAGSIVGTGSCSDGRIKGAAPGAKLYVTGLLNKDYELVEPPYSQIFQPDARYVAKIHSSSWGYYPMKEYSSYDREADEYAWRTPESLPVFAVGNDRSANTANPPATAKNVLAVGATESSRSGVSYSYLSDNPSQVASLSSKGPTADGRIKPDICAPGTYIVSTLSLNAASRNLEWGTYGDSWDYTYCGGTSMACPLVAGAAALVRQWLVERMGLKRPSAALVKAVLLGGAHDMSGDAGNNCGGAAPNSTQGWGRINLEETIYPSGRAVKLVDWIPFSDGSTYSIEITTTNAAPLDVQLVWIDYPGVEGAGTAIVNDLDLTVSCPATGETWRGNGADDGDRVNTVESVRIASAPPGTYVVSVRSVSVPYDSDEGGAAALYVRGAFKGKADRGTDAPATPLCRETHFPLLDEWWLSAITWHPSGTVVRVESPADLPYGAEVVSGLIWTDDATGDDVQLDDQRLAEVEVAPTNNATAGTMRYDAAGRMATSFDVKMDSPTDVRFRYYSVTNVDEDAGLPTWWRLRNLAGAAGDGGAGWAAGDADGDGVSNAAEYAADTDPLDALSFLRVTEFSPTRIAWKGGVESRQVLERAESLEAGAEWVGVHTNLPPTAAETSLPLVPAGPGAFYRVRVER